MGNFKTCKFGYFKKDGIRNMLGQKLSSVLELQRTYENSGMYLPVVLRIPEAEKG